MGIPQRGRAQRALAPVLQPLEVAAAPGRALADLGASVERGLQQAVAEQEQRDAQDKVRRLNQGEMAMNEMFTTLQLDANERTATDFHGMTDDVTGRLDAAFDAYTQELEPDMVEALRLHQSKLSERLRLAAGNREIGLRAEAGLTALGDALETDKDLILSLPSVEVVFGGASVHDAVAAQRRRVGLAESVGALPSGSAGAKNIRDDWSKRTATEAAHKVVNEFTLVGQVSPSDIKSAFMDRSHPIFGALNEEQRGQFSAAIDAKAKHLETEAIGERTQLQEAKRQGFSDAIRRIDSPVDAARVEQFVHNEGHGPGKAFRDESDKRAALDAIDRAVVSMQVGFGWADALTARADDPDAPPVVRTKENKAEIDRAANSLYGGMLNLVDTLNAHEPDETLRESVKGQLAAKFIAAESTWGYLAPAHEAHIISGLRSHKQDELFFAAKQLEAIRGQLNGAQLSDGFKEMDLMLAQTFLNRVQGGGDPEKALLDAYAMADQSLDHKSKIDRFREEVKVSLEGNVDLAEDAYNEFFDSVTDPAGLNWLQDAPEIPPGLKGLYEANFRALYELSGEYEASRDTASTNIQRVYGPTKVGTGGVTQLSMFPIESVYNMSKEEVDTALIDELTERGVTQRGTLGVPLDVKNVRIVPDRASSLGRPAYNIRYIDTDGSLNWVRDDDGHLASWAPKPPRFAITHMNANRWLAADASKQRLAQDTRKWMMLGLGPRATSSVFRAQRKGEAALAAQMNADPNAVDL